MIDLWMKMSTHYMKEKMDLSLLNPSPPPPPLLLWVFGQRDIGHGCLDKEKLGPGHLECPEYLDIEALGPGH